MTDVQERSYMDKKNKKYNRCLVIGLRAPVKVHLTFWVNLEGGLHACGICTNIFDHPLHPPYKDQIKFQEESDTALP